MAVAERNERVKEIISGWLEEAEAIVESGQLPDVDDDLRQTLEQLIPISVMGFRGIPMVAMVGIELDETYVPLPGFYACNPRPLFEEGIHGVLQEHKIPCGKSDPLNVAKNSDLTEEWARGKRPESAALAVLKFLRNYIDNPNDRARLRRAFFVRLIQYRDQIAETTVVQPEIEGESNGALATKLIKFALEFPEAGAVPQFLVGAILEVIHKSSELCVCGADESVFGTNTTGKKPADIWLERDGAVESLFEVTVKVVNKKRLTDSVEALFAMNLKDLPLTFVCRIPEDTRSLELDESGSIEISGKQVDFVDFGSFIRSQLSVLSRSASEALTVRLSEFVNDHNRKEKTRQGWNEIFS
ncbi:MAG: hypothetical protein R3217_08480 [Gammaproteobacteria bacterium]|nr:hypothetical protein [Gammaproteobacteria bacterium]